MLLPEIETTRLSLRKPADSDAEAIFDLYSNPEVMRYTGEEPWDDPEEAVEFIEGARSGLQEKTLFGWCIQQKGSPELIGTCALFNCDLGQQVAEVSYECHPDYWNRGYTREFLPHIITFGFNALNLNRITAYVAAGNIYSVRLLSGLGFQMEGMLRESWISADGSPIDEYVMGLLKREWDDSLAEPRS